MHDDHNAENAGSPQPREEQSNLMMDDINIPLVATSVAFFAVLLTITIISLQAAFYNYEASETAAKTLKQEDPHTELGAILQDQRRELHSGFDARRLAQASATGSAPATATQARPNWVSIDTAMQLVARDYSQAKP